MTPDTLVIVVYNRLQNVQTWLHILKQCPPVQVVVIHNTDTPQPIEGCIYIPRPNVGFDIGAFQDVCKGRLQGFPAWNRLLWCTDDCFPMTENFLEHFAGDNVRCMKISPFVRKHIRTTGFAISRGQAQKLVFPAEPVTTKEDCYQFEHRSLYKTFLSQCPNAKQVAPDETSPLWDTGYHRKLDRYAEFKQKWGVDAPTIKDLISVNTVEVICPIYKQFPAIISSMIMQTHKNWRLKLIHDGPDESGVESYVNAINDDRISFECRPHVGYWGHKHRSDALQESKGDYTLITNSDNFYVAAFLEKMIPKVKSVASYCLQMVHNYKNWEVINCRMERGFVDCGSVLLNTKAAQAVGWNDVTSHSADWVFFNDMIKAYGKLSFNPVKGCLFVHC